MVPISIVVTRQRARRIRVRCNDRGRLMHISDQGILVILLVGLIAGWLAGRIVDGGGFGLIGDIAVGIVGALIGSWLLPKLGIHMGSGLVSSIIVATLGAILLLLIVRFSSVSFPSRCACRL